MHSQLLPRYDALYRTYKQEGARNVTTYKRSGSGQIRSILPWQYTQSTYMTYKVSVIQPRILRTDPFTYTVIYYTLAYSFNIGTDLHSAFPSVVVLLCLSYSSATRTLV